MERIVLGLSAISFSNSNESMAQSCSTDNKANQALIPGTSSLSKELSDNSSVSSAQSDATSPVHNRRHLPSRRAKLKENGLLRVKRRTTMKPCRSRCPSSANQTDIRKLYLESNIAPNFRPTNLETIYEEPTTDKDKHMRYIGLKKIRRSLSCSDGLNATKSTLKLRRSKAKKLVNHRYNMKKMSLEDFLSRLNASLHLNEDAQPAAGDTTGDPAADVIDNEMDCEDL